MVRTVAGLVAGRTRIDRAEAVNGFYPGFFREMEELGVRDSSSIVPCSQYLIRKEESRFIIIKPRLY